jgi:hypothetical protein
MDMAGWVLGLSPFARTGGLKNYEIGISLSLFPTISSENSEIINI